MTELTDTIVRTHEGAIRGWVFFDGDCRLCRRNARRFGPALRRRGFRVTPLQSTWARRKLNVREDGDTLLREMRVVTRDGRRFGGGEAVLFLAGRFWWAWPLHMAGRAFPLVRRAVGRAYAWVARNRHCFNGACTLPAR